MQYRLEKNKILISLERGDEIFDSIHTVVDEAGIKFGWINGIGAAENITLGAYPMEIKDYIKKEFEGEFVGATNTLISGGYLKNLVFKSPIENHNGIDIYEHQKEDRVYVIGVDVTINWGFSGFFVIAISFSKCLFQNVFS